LSPSLLLLLLLSLSLLFSLSLFPSPLSLSLSFPLSLFPSPSPERSHAHPSGRHALLDLLVVDVDGDLLALDDGDLLGDLGLAGRQQAVAAADLLVQLGQSPEQVVHALPRLRGRQGHLS